MTVRNRVWDANAGPAFVSWETTFPDTQGVDYPGPGTFGVDTSDYTVSGGVAEVVGPESSPDDTFSPAERWLFDGSLVGENGVQNIDQVRSGAAAYIASPIPGAQAFNFTGQLIDSGVPIDPSVEITGDLTIQMWVYTANSLGTFGARVMSCTWRENGGDSNNTFLMGVLFVTVPGRMAWGWEDNTGTFQGVSTDGGGVPDLAVDTWHHLVLTRDVSGGPGSCVAEMWLNGVLHVSNSALNPPGTSVNNRYIRMGDATNSPPTDANNQTFTGRAHGMTFYDRRLEQHEIVALYKKGIPEVQR